MVNDWMVIVMVLDFPVWMSLSEDSFVKVCFGFIYCPIHGRLHSFSETQKKDLLFQIYFTDILECSINKKNYYKDNSKKGTQKSSDKWYRKKVNTFSIQMCPLSRS